MGDARGRRNWLNALSELLRYLKSIDRRVHLWDHHDMQNASNAERHKHMLSQWPSPAPSTALILIGADHLWRDDGIVASLQQRGCQCTVAILDESNIPAAYLPQKLPSFAKVISLSSFPFERCSVCRQETKRLCPWCKITYWCGEEHQQNQWAAHKKSCLRWCE